MNELHRKAFTHANTIAVVAMLAMFFGCLPVAIVHAREVADRTACVDNLKRMGTASRQFADANDNVLPNNQLNSPYMSWNARLLPFVGQEDLAKKYSLAQDWWDSAHSTNRTAAQSRISTFVCPSAPHSDRWVLTIDPDADANFKAAPTDYVGSAGAYLNGTTLVNLQQGAMMNSKRVRWTDIVDGTSNTILVVEMADKPNAWRAGALDKDKSQAAQMTTFGGGQWAAPNWNHLRSYDEKGQKQFGPCAVNCSNGASIYGFHEGGANVLFVDGTVHFLKAGLAQEVMVALVSISGGEALANSDY